MSDITVRALGENEWEQYRSVRLNALDESPDAFVATADEERGFEEDLWVDVGSPERYLTATRLLLVRTMGELGSAEVRLPRPALISLTPSKTSRQMSRSASNWTSARPVSFLVMLERLR